MRSAYELDPTNGEWRLIHKAPDPMTICNGCDMRPAMPGNAAGYCVNCERAARRATKEG